MGATFIPHNYEKLVDSISLTVIEEENSLLMDEKDESEEKVVIFEDEPITPIGITQNSDDDDVQYI